MTWGINWLGMVSVLAQRLWQFLRNWFKSPPFFTFTFLSKASAHILSYYELVVVSRVDQFTRTTYIQPHIIPRCVGLCSLGFTGPSACGCSQHYSHLLTLFKYIQGAMRIRYRHILWRTRDPLLKSMCWIMPISRIKIVHLLVLLTFSNVWIIWG